MLVGVDVGVTALNAVLLDGVHVRAAVSQPATPSLTGGVVDVLRRLRDTAPRAAAARAVVISTARLATAVAGAAGLARTGCVRLCASAAESVPPLAGWPAALRDALGEHVFLCDGGHEFDGAPLRPLDERSLERIARTLAAQRVDAVAITSVFSPANNETELAAAGLLRARAPGLHIATSHEIGSIGLLERENATIINAALLPLADRIASELGDEVAAVAPTAGVYLARSDGTVMELSFARRYPVLTFWAGVSSALRGAAVLSGHPDCVVVDAGPRSATVGVVSDGYPRQSLQYVSLGGVRANLRRPATRTLHHGSGPAAVDTAALEHAVQDAAPHGSRPVVIVGPGAAAVPAGFGAVAPGRGAFAAAVGAASLHIGGEVERIVSGDRATRTAAVARARSLAVQKAVLAGAAEATIRVTEVEELPLAYLPGDFVRLRVKAVGDLV